MKKYISPINILVSQIILFFWYYVSLPGSILPPHDKKLTKPSITTSLIKFITFMTPYYILLYLALKNYNLV
jgi:hypothetical protein